MTRIKQIMTNLSFPEELAIDINSKLAPSIDGFYFEVFETLREAQVYANGNESNNSSHDKVQLPEEADTAQIYTQVDSTTNDERLYSKGIHIANRTGMYAVVFAYDNFNCWKCGSIIRSDGKQSNLEEYELIQEGAIEIVELAGSYVEKELLGLYCSQKCFKEAMNVEK